MSETRREAERISTDWHSDPCALDEELINAIDCALQARDERAAKIAETLHVGRILEAEHLRAEIIAAIRRDN